MSRSGYSDDCDSQEARWTLIRWRGAVNSAIKGKRGQAFLREALAALDALPEKRLIAKDLAAHGEFCTLGAVGARRGIDMSEVDPEDYETVAPMFGISEALAREIVYLNDDCVPDGQYIPRPCGPPTFEQWQIDRGSIGASFSRQIFVPFKDRES